MTDLDHNSSLFWVCDLFEVCVCKEDFVDDQFLAFRLNVVADIVGMFTEDKDARVAEFKEDTTECKGQSCQTRPECSQIFGV